MKQDKTRLKARSKTKKKAIAHMSITGSFTVLLLFLVNGICSTSNSLFIALLSMSKNFGDYFTFFGKNAFDWMDFMSSSILMPFAALMICVFLGFFTDKEMLKEKFTQHTSEEVFDIWYVLVKFIVPFAIAILFLNKLGLI